MRRFTKQPVRVAVIGYGAAGTASARYALSTNRQCTVIVFEKRRHAIYHPCSLPSVIAGEITLDRIIEEAPVTPRLTLSTSTVVEDIDVEGRRIRARDLRRGCVVNAEYDALVLATGSKPYIPSNLRIEDSSGVFTLKTLEDVNQALAAISKYDDSVVIGGSILGVEVAHALVQRGKRVTLIEKELQLLPGRLDKEIAEHVSKQLAGEGVDVLLGEAAVEVRGDLGDVTVVTSSGRVLKAGFAIIATGVKPDTRLAKQIGLELGMTGGVKVDETMKTSKDSVYAAGDLVEVRNILTGKPTLSLFASTAFLTGRVAGINAAGGEARFPGTLQSWVAHIGAFKLGAVGLSEAEAGREDLEPISSTLTLLNRPPFHTGAKAVTVKLIASRRDGRILGLQAVGEGNVLELLNVAALAIARGTTIEELWSFEHAYTPTLNDVVHPLHAAAEALEKRLGRRAISR